MFRNTRKGYRDRPRVPMNSHAIDRFRSHWPEAAFMYDSEVRFQISEQILDALARDDRIIAPGGIYVPISVLGRDGYAVLLNQRVVTVMPVDWCKEVDTTRKKREEER
jgi:hypothetical protein